MIILTIDFGQDKDTRNGNSGIDYLLTTFFYYLISELKFDNPEDHTIVRYCQRKLNLVENSLWPIEETLKTKDIESLGSYGN